jgi:hypothetical protein
MDKYYTPRSVAQRCVEWTKETFPLITSYLEPSAGSGVFLEFLPIGTPAYDISPDTPQIIQQDFLTCSIPYQKGRCVIGNPPYGKRFNQYVNKFIKKSIEIADYVGFVLPYSYFENPSYIQGKQGPFYQLIKSFDLGQIRFDGLNTLKWSCFNLYQRSKIRPSLPRLEQVTIKRSERRRRLYLGDCDLRICYYGSSAGVVCDHPNQYCGEYCFFIDEVVREQVIDALRKAKYPDMLKTVSSVQQWWIIDYLKRTLPNLR